jgi:hypothetical protein
MSDAILDELEAANPVLLEQVQPASEEKLRRLLDSIVEPPRRRRRWVLLAAAAVVVGAVAAVLAIDPFAGRRAVTPADALAETARALDLRGAWHVATTSATVQIKTGSTPPLPSGFRTDVWHAPDGRLVVTSDTGSTTLFSGRTRQDYDRERAVFTTHRYALAADMADDERAYAPLDIPRVFQLAYRYGKVRVAGIVTQGGRQVYRLAFAWAGVTYTLSFDASRQVPLSSEASYPMGVGERMLTRITYLAYESVQPGPDLDARFTLHVPPGTVTLRDPVIVVPQARQGGSAAVLIRKLDDAGIAASPAAGSRYLAVAPVPGGGYAALVVHRSKEHGKRCTTGVVVGHAGGEVRLWFGNCADDAGIGAFGGLAPGGRGQLLAGEMPGRRVEVRLSDGSTVSRPIVDRHFLLVLPPTKTAMHITRIDADGRRRAAPTLFAWGGLPPWAAG